MIRHPGIWLTLLALPALAQGAPTANAITGIWLNSAKEGYIQIYRTDAGTYAGRIVGDTDGVVAKDIHNPDPAKRDESLLGRKIFHGFEYNGEGRWVGGEIYNPRNGETYSAWLALSDQGKLKVHGYIGFSLFGVTKLFTRVDRGAKGVVESALVPIPPPQTKPVSQNAGAP